MKANRPETGTLFPMQDSGERPSAIVYRFVDVMARRYRALCEDATPGCVDASAVEQRQTELQLAEAVLRLLDHAKTGSAKTPVHISILGPTQTGKSTVTNLLAGGAVAEVSPLAGFTIHPHAFAVGDAESEAPGWAADLFPGWKRVAGEDLSRDRLESYAITRVDSTGDRVDVRSPCVIWDTPDFDSLAARSYQQGVLEVAALSDLHVLVLSKEKYSDLSVWKMLRLLRPLGRKLLVCLNKVTPDAADAVTASLRQRLAELDHSSGSTPIVTIGYHASIADGDGEFPEKHALLQQVANRASAAPLVSRNAGARAYVRLHWANWIAPIEQELAAAGEWATRVQAALDQGLAAYERDFLRHPQRFDTFRRAMAELLNLLELPGVGGAVSRVRYVVSWPARQLFAARQRWQGRRRGADGGSHASGSEAVVLYEIIEKTLTGLLRDALRSADPTLPGSAVWRAVASRLGRREDELRSAFRAAAEKQRKDFEPTIRQTAGQLYETLQKKPAVLNTLRAARATVDVASVLAAIKAGGLSVHDLVFSPALFAITSMLTEGALGSYMKRVEKEVQQQQLQHVRETLFDGAIASALRNLTADLDEEGLIGVSSEQLGEATVALETWGRAGDE